MKNTLGEIFNHNKKLIKNADKVKWLRENACVQLYYFLWVALSGKCQWLVAEGMPELEAPKGRSARALARGAAGTNISQELRRFYIFLDGTGNNLPVKRRDNLYKWMLEGMSPDEVELMVAVKDGKFESSYRCPKKVVEEAFPGLMDAPFQNRFLKV